MCVPLVGADSVNLFSAHPLRSCCFHRLLLFTSATPLLRFQLRITWLQASPPHAPTLCQCLAVAYVSVWNICQRLARTLPTTFWHARTDTHILRQNKKKSEKMSRIFFYMTKCPTFEVTKCHTYERTIIQNRLRNRDEYFSGFD